MINYTVSNVIFLICLVALVSSQDSCYKNQSGLVKAKRCKPPFEILNPYGNFQSSSHCVHGKDLICPSQGEKCFLCPANHFNATGRKPEKVDINFLGKEYYLKGGRKCWYSPPLVGKKVNDVNLTISFPKTVLPVYVRITPCGTFPDSVVLYRSLDYGKTFKRWHIFSDECWNKFKMPVTNWLFLEKNLQSDQVCCLLFSSSIL